MSWKTTEEDDTIEIRCIQVGSCTHCWIKFLREEIGIIHCWPPNIGLTADQGKRVSLFTERILIIHFCRQRNREILCLLFLSDWETIREIPVADRPSMSLSHWVARRYGVLRYLSLVISQVLSCCKIFSRISEAISKYTIWRAAVTLGL